PAVIRLPSGAVIPQRELGRSGCIRSQQAIEKCARLLPVALYRGYRNVEDFRDLLDGEATEIAQLDDLVRPLVDARELNQSTVECFDVHFRSLHLGLAARQRDVSNLTPTLARVSPAHVVDDDAAHH